MDKDMPEEIWARPDTYEGVWNTAPDGYTGETKYTRTDRYEALQKLAQDMAGALDEIDALTCLIFQDKNACDADRGKWGDKIMIETANLRQAYEQFMKEEE